jgi:hypothetical protein
MFRRLRRLRTRRGLSRADEWALYALVVVVAAGMLAVWAWTVLLPSAPHTEPSVFSPAQSPEEIPSGSPGCSSAGTDLCYSFSIVTYYSGLTVGHFEFQVDENWSSLSSSGPVGTPVSLGPDAQISVLGPKSAVEATWNCAVERWSGTAGWIVPTGTNVSFVLQTGLESNATVQAASMFIGLAPPYGGWVGYGFS